jgi:3-hydroxybutyryl-CoA dehydrogenase
LYECFITIEAVIENIDVKKKIFRDLDTICPPGTILGSNTSSMSITEIAGTTTRPDKVIGIHFFNPAPIMGLVELIKGIATSEETFDKVKNLVADLGKTAVKVEESPGFVVNRILIPMINESVCVYSEGVASAEEIDNAMKLGANHPIGPLALADMIGLDVVLAIMDNLHKEIGDDKYRPHNLLRKMVRGGMLGKKTKSGFYRY